MQLVTSVDELKHVPQQVADEHLGWPVRELEDEAYGIEASALERNRNNSP